MLARHEFLMQYPWGCYEGYVAGVLAKRALDEALSMARLRNIMAGFTQDQINAGFVADAEANKALGFSNE